MGVLTRDLNCREAVALVTDYLDGSLNRRQRRRLESHLKACPNCGRYLEQIRMTIRLVGHVDPEELDQHARDELIGLYRRFKGESSDS